jgi:hypothetical protein
MEGQTTGAGPEDECDNDEAGAFEAGAFEAGAFALVPLRPQKRQKTVLTVSASLVPGDAGDISAPGTHRAIAAVGVPKSQLCTAAASAPLLEREGISEQQRAELPVHVPLPFSVMVHASAEME